MKTGDIAPNFKLKDQNGNDFELYENLNKKVLLIFYPKDETPVCSTQLAEYNNNRHEFDE
jgi:peroxiredoxin Q/BCP